MAARKAMTVSELCDLYLADAEAGRLLTRRRGATTLRSASGGVCALHFQRRARARQMARPG